MQTFLPRKNWVLGLGIGLGIIPKPKTQNPKIFIPKPKTQKLLYLNPKPKTQKFLYPNLNPKPKNFYTQTQNPRIVIPKPKTQNFLYPNPKPKNCYTQTQKLFYLNQKPKPKTQIFLYPNPKPKPEYVLGTNVSCSPKLFINHIIIDVPSHHKDLLPIQRAQKVLTSLGTRRCHRITQLTVQTLVLSRVQLVGGEDKLERGQLQHTLHGRLRLAREANRRGQHGHKDHNLLISVQLGQISSQRNIIFLKI